MLGNKRTKPLTKRTYGPILRIAGNTVLLVQSILFIGGDSIKRRNHTDINIYLITNTVNNKVYIGQTYRKIHTRFMEHLIDPESGIYADVCKFGRGVFKYELLRICKPEYADQWEHYYICKYSATNPDFGYNRTVNTAYRWLSGKLNPSQTKEGKQRISEYNKSHMDQITKGFRAYNESRKFPVGMVDDLGQIIMTFESLNAACKYLNKPPCGSTRIRLVCDQFRKNGKPYKFYGYAWTALNKNVQTIPCVGSRSEDELPIE